MQQFEDEEEDFSKGRRRVKLNEEQSSIIPLIPGILDMIFQFLTPSQHLQMRLVSHQCNTVVQQFMKKFLVTQVQKGTFQQFNNFIRQFSSLNKIKLPPISSDQHKLCDDINPQYLTQVIFHDFLNDSQSQQEYLKEFFQKYTSINSVGINKFLSLKWLPLENIKQLDLSSVMEIKDKSFLENCRSLVSLSFHIQEINNFFSTSEFPPLEQLKVLKIKLWGPTFKEEHYQNFLNFLESIKNLEILELLFCTYESNCVKQDVFNAFVTKLPQLRILYAFSCYDQIQNTQFRQRFDYLVIENNTYIKLKPLDIPTLETLLAFTNILDITKCKLEEENEKQIQEFLEKQRKCPAQKYETILKVSFEQKHIIAEYEDFPKVQKNSEFTTFWNSGHYSI
ncbi:unnamed protein product [Paramecium pentaurelia]|uniref:F-box domain-containing protein n=1 Tax=Paramecium pentaurelia TaxID=43138 RepID=A0A8S1WWZ5_9CILI|nr:unnamed protein product [Paramecium pentaurelia]